MAVMELAENDHRIRCALFGEYVDKLNRFLSSGMLNSQLWFYNLPKLRFLEVELDFRMLCLHQILDLILTSQRWHLFGKFLFHMELVHPNPLALLVLEKISE
ncbi:hypothetical protein S245_043462 [Arachis hypogaea]